MSRTSVLLAALAAVTVACASTGASEDRGTGTPTESMHPSPSDSAPASASPTPAPSPMSPIPDGRYSTTVRDAEDTFFGEAPARVLLELDRGEYSLKENDIQFESGVYWGTDQHIELDAAVGPCAAPSHTTSTTGASEEACCVSRARAGRSASAG